jgi:hypothetical protein
MQNNNSYLLYFAIVLVAIYAIKTLFRVEPVTEIVVPPSSEEEMPVEKFTCGSKYPSGYYPGGYSGSMNEQMTPKEYPVSIPEASNFEVDNPHINTGDSYPEPLPGSVWNSKQKIPHDEFDLPKKYPLLSN